MKSLIAASLFNGAARDRRLPFHAVARGIAPEDAVPPEIAKALREDRIEVGAYKPERLAPTDFDGAARVVAIGVDLTGVRDRSSAGIEEWNDVPPASVDYVASRASLLRHLNALLDTLQASQGQMER